MSVPVSAEDVITLIKAESLRRGITMAALMIECTLEIICSEDDLPSIEHFDGEAIEEVLAAALDEQQGN